MKEIGPYKILELLGEGGMGEVYLAEQRHPLRRRVALKLIKRGIDTREVLARFEAERQALALMDHEAIAKVFEAGSDGGLPYFAMEYVPGQPITDYCDDRKLGVEERLELFGQACRGVHHAHSRGVVHRDIKPSNILVTSPEDRPLAKIIDFGVAKATNQRLTEKTVYTELGRIIGTPGYMSPEQAELTPENVDQRTDVYSLGVLLYELLVGERPIDVDRVGYDEIRRRIRDEEPVKPSTRWIRLSLEEQTRRSAARHSTTPTTLLRELRGDLDWVCMKALEKDRDRRYATAAELAADVERYLRREPVLAGPPSGFYRLRKLARRHRRLAVTTAAVLGILAAGFVVSVLFAVESRAYERQAKASEEDVRENLELAERKQEEARRSYRLARDRLDEVLRLSDLKRLRDYEAEADSLWPATSEKLPAMRDWLERATELPGRLDGHRATLQSLRDRAERRPDGRWEFETNEDQWWHGALVELVDGLEAFERTIVDVEKRSQRAATSRQRTIDDYRDRWDAARRSIADREECPLYGGLEIEPQEGLVPLGRDPKSGLWEFAVPETGALPERRDGVLVASPESALVLVLLPGGAFRMGAAHPDPLVRGAQTMVDSLVDKVSLPFLSSQDPADFRAALPANVDPGAEGDESPVHDVVLDPFFLSKYEMTQGQWLRVTGENPSHGRTPQRGLLHPVDNVSWDQCTETLRRLGLTLPTEAQWEYGARAGTTTVWSTGNTLESLAGQANLANHPIVRLGYEEPTRPEWTKVTDPWTTHSPVGSFAPNAFGLHDVHGNLWELCRDGYASYRQKTAPGDGERPRPAGEAFYPVYRGGCFYETALDARSANRKNEAPAHRSAGIGLRPARRLQGRQ